MDLDWSPPRSYHGNCGANDQITLLTDEPRFLLCLSPQEQYGVPSGGHREMDCGGRHLPLPAQFQRGSADLRSLHQCGCVPAEEDLGQGAENGEYTFMGLGSVEFYKEYRHLPQSRLSKRLRNCKRSFVPMAGSGLCVRYCIGAIHRVFHTWACT